MILILAVASTLLPSCDYYFYKMSCLGLFSAQSVSPELWVWRLSGSWFSKCFLWYICSTSHKLLVHDSACNRTRRLHARGGRMNLEALQTPEDNVHFRPPCLTFVSHISHWLEVDNDRELVIRFAVALRSHPAVGERPFGGNPQVPFWAENLLDSDGCWGDGTRDPSVPSVPNTIFPLRCERPNQVVGHIYQPTDSGRLKSGTHIA